MILLVSAFPPELATLRPHLGETLRASIGGHDVMAKAVGIGLPTAAIGMAGRLEALRPTAVILVGTCGVYPGVSIGLNEVVVARKVRLVDPAAAEGRAAFPAPMSLEGETNAAIALALVERGGRAADLATTLAVASDDDLAVLLRDRTRSAAQHLEAFGIASACATFGVPFATALGVANVVGTPAREQWRANHKSASAAATELVVRWISDGASGVPV